MISEAEARQKILDAVSALETERLPLEAALGRFIRSELVATIPLPSFDNSSMDGYAVRASDARPNAELRIAGEQPAGIRRQLSVGAGEAIRIFTGAPIPEGADAVVMQEEVETAEAKIRILTAVEAEENIRQAGGDLAAGQRLAAPGDRLTPRLAALLASQGMAEVDVGRAARAAVLSTGDELAEPGRALKPGEIYESNGLLLAGMLRQTGALPIRLGIAPDDAEKLKALLEAGLKHDALIISGGVSVGEHDLVKDVLKQLGADLSIWRVAIRPGKPFLFGSHGRCLIFGLPGNPVSSYVTFLRFVRPALLKLMGARDLEPATIEVELTEPLRNDSDRPHYVRGRIRAGRFEPVGRQESHALAALARADALLRVGPGETLAAGTHLSALSLD